ncbi:uncharacterized protein [Macrobrachium rosenbergii]|uniref:uncharacterized protein n=1 Tax=Macrobrachium rosenbergii TaxID=79674 RepID=UPI0034D42DE5
MFSLRGAQEWKLKWSDYTTLIDFHTLPQPKQFASLRLCLEDEVLHVLDHTLGVKPDSTLPVDDIINTIITHIKEQRNESLRRLEFTKCRQQPGETFDNFWVRLKQIADDIDLCKGSNCVDNQLKHAILVGLTDNETVQHLLRMKANTSLSDFLTVVRSRKAAQRTSSAIQVEYQPAKGTMNAISIYKKSMKKQNHQNKQEASSNKKATPEEALQKKTNKGQSCYWCAVFGNKQGLLDVIPDTGSDTTVIGRQHLQSLGIQLKDLDSSDTLRLRNPDDRDFNGSVLGSMQATMTYGNESTTGWINVMSNLSRPLLSWSHAQALRIVPQEFPQQIPKKSEQGQVKHVSQNNSLPQPSSSSGSPSRKSSADIMSELLQQFPDVQVPYSWQEDVKSELEALVTQGIIAPAGGQPSVWCHPMVAVPQTKKEDASHFVGPMGLCSTGDEYNRRGDEALSGIPNLAKVVDDIIIWDDDLESHCQHIKDVLNRCRAHVITLNAEKMCIASPSVSFCGYTISETGIAANKDKIKAITEFPTPANITDLRSFMGLVNQLAEFTPDIASTAQVLRPLMSPKNSFIWTSDHNAAFLKTKKALAEPPILAHFDHTLPTVLQTDASRLNGIGYALLQEHAGVWRLVQCGSRFLADVESRYSTIELEMLAVVWAMKKCKYYLLGLAQFSHITDHKPLIPLLNSYTLDCIENPRLQRLREKISGYVFTSTWRKGKDLCIPDALSRAPVDTPTEDDVTLGNETSMCIRSAVIRSIATIRNLSISAGPVTTTQDTSSSDPILEEIRVQHSSTKPTNRSSNK